MRFLENLLESVCFLEKLLESECVFLKSYKNLQVLS